MVISLSHRELVKLPIVDDMPSVDRSTIVGYVEHEYINPWQLVETPELDRIEQMNCFPVIVTLDNDGVVALHHGAGTPVNGHNSDVDIPELAPEPVSYKLKKALVRHCAMAEDGLQQLNVSMDILMERAYALQRGLITLREFKGVVAMELYTTAKAAGELC